MLWGCRVLTRTLGDILAHDHFHLIGGRGGAVRTSKLQAQSGFDGEQLTQSFGDYLEEKRGSDLASVVRVGVGRVQST